MEDIAEDRKLVGYETKRQSFVYPQKKSSIHPVNKRILTSFFSSSNNAYHPSNFESFQFYDCYPMTSPIFSLMTSGVNGFTT